ncbi:methyltransferase [Duganella sp. FT80W]|uniref:Methyltransferase n=1 Tax=Duganella guangzhouensis TaxID=2666084 RepID=A0A6I2KY32_9BURK|nr:class I SAM-dependent methyltransferase [Duganella guangzhouensis]MRW91045.1 methyltransferase [Duganella guangzhouensis]
MTLSQIFRPLAALSLGGLLLLGASAAGAAGQAPLAKEAVADPRRPDADKARDGDRKPDAMLDFARVQPGQTVIDYFPGRGYFTRLLSTAVGPQGAVYAAAPQLWIDRLKGKPLPPPVSAEAGRGNVHEVVAGASMNVPVKADLVWTSQNYHDIHIWGGAAGTAQLNKAAFDALRPGGYYIVLDHAGVAGLDDAGMAKLHRIDEALVKQEVLAAGFVLDGESQALRNPADDRTAQVFETGIRAHTDQFILRFRKP